jgi:hypothetical protein
VITPLSGDQFDIDKYRSMDPITMMLTMRKDLEFKLPPVGKSTHTAYMAGIKWVRTTWRCDKPGCWFVSTPSSDANLQTIIEWHNGQGEDRCPTPPRRESLPSGLPEIEKLWREIDDVVDAIKAKDSYRGMEAAAMNGYVRGLAFSVVMKDKELWPDIKAVSMQAMKRWKMRNKLLPWEPTPTRHSNDFNSIGQKGGWAPANPPPTQPIKRAPVKKTAPAAPKINLTEQQQTSIKAGHGSGMFSVAELANMYGATEEQVKQLVG